MAFELINWTVIVELLTIAQITSRYCDLTDDMNMDKCFICEHWIFRIVMAN